IVFVGCNIIYHSMEANDTAVLNIVSDVFDIEPNELPQRKFVDINITYSRNRIIIDTPEEGVNTTISYQDNFKYDNSIINENNLLKVTKNHTELQLVYPYLKQGIFISILGLVGIVALLFLITHKKKNT
ncbi:MAG: 6-pyruvoyl-tetrahydropterin synthase, partial [Clostridiales bacterium]|nr:6-pyruvoyl-tetrahydropterin synthase [Clostridiales bacterium]